MGYGVKALCMPDIITIIINIIIIIM